MSTKTINTVLITICAIVIANLLLDIIMIKDNKNE